MSTVFSPLSGGALVRRLRSLSGRDEAELVPQSRLAGPMPWVIAIMVALTTIAAAAGLAASNVASNASEALSGGVTVQIIEADPAARSRQAEAAALRLNAIPGVAQATVVGQDQVERLIEPWLGGMLNCE